MKRPLLFLMGALAVSAIASAQTTPTAPPAPAPNSSATTLARSLSKAFADVYERVAPGVVVIEAESVSEGDAVVTGSPLSQFFLDPAIPRRSPREENQGSGFILTTDGYILTNNHVLAGAAPDSVQVTLKDGRKLPAQIVGVDPVSDLAVIKVEATGLPVLELADSDQTRVGEFAFAIGSPFALRDTFTYGIVSAKGRTDITGSPSYEEFIQTDAAINPGNSGGPLVDIDGRVIGVNTLIRDFNRGLGFAIPINIAKKVASQLIADGRAIRPWLGISIRSLEDMPELTERYPDLPPGILVLGIEPNTPAAFSELQRNDIITRVDGQPVKTARELQKLIFDKKIGQEVVLDVWRNRRTVQVTLRTAEQTRGVLPVVNQRPANVSPAPSAPGAKKKTTPPPARIPSPTAGLTVRTFTADLAVAMNLPGEEGVLVTSVQPGSEAAAAGVQVGDVITAVGDTPIRAKEDFVKALRESPGDAVMINLNRGTEKTYGILKRN